MNQRTMLAIAAGVTAFVLVIVGGLATRLSQNPTPPVAEVAATDTALPTLDPATEQLIREREAAYQRALDEANAKLAEANARIAQANQQAEQAVVAAPTALPVAPAAAADPAPTYAVSLIQARDLALSTVPGATLSRDPELVNYQGIPAYEVVLNSGTLYIDAQTAAVLFNGAAQQAVTGGPVDADQAAAIAVQYLGGGEVRKVERERERGIEVYEVKFSDGSEVYVVAETGQVAYAEIKGGGGEHEDDDD
ncbi:MAG: PepSY domain-containing protein [Roseiflexaceae bacterium]